MWMRPMQLDVGLVGPNQDGVAGEFAAVVANDHLGFAALD
jgi:hypothetical protein